MTVILRRRDKLSPLQESLAEAELIRARAQSEQARLGIRQTKAEMDKTEFDEVSNMWMSVGRFNESGDMSTSLDILSNNIDRRSRDDRESPAMTEGLRIFDEDGPDAFREYADNRGARVISASPSGVDTLDTIENRNRFGMELTPRQEQKVKEAKVVRQRATAKETRAATESAAKIAKAKVEAETTQFELSEKRQSAVEKTEKAKYSAERGLVQLKRIDTWMENKGDSFLGADGQGIWAATSFIPGTDAYELDSMLESLKAKAFMENIQNLRGMGQLSNMEGDKAQAAIANLDPGAGPEILAQQLGEIKDFLNIALDRAQKGIKVNSKGELTKDGVIVDPETGNEKKGVKW